MFPSNRELNGYSEAVCSPSRLELPEVSGSQSDGEMSDESTDVFHLLSDSVRREYLNYLEKLLNANYETWMICNPPGEERSFNLEDLHVCAKKLEQEALRSCMIVSLYRKAMLGIISGIRHETKNQKLSSRLMQCHSKISTKFSNAETQTDQENFLIERYFQEVSALPVSSPPPKKKKRKSAKKRRKSPSEGTTHQSVVVPEKDEVEANLEKLFASENNEVDIFENVGDYKLVISEVKSESPKFIQDGDSKEAKESLRDSAWPCELRMQRKKLFEVMCAVGESSLRRYERVKMVFRELFGEDSDDEEVPPSPSNDMDEVTMNSCRKRVAPMIVKHLMKPFNGGLIANRWLFKKLAKRMADSILIENDYPDERYVRNFIDEYFAIHPKITDISDIVTDI